MNANGLLNEAVAVVGEGFGWLVAQTGLSVVELVVALVLLALFLVFFGGSGKGRGRRYRRGYWVAYREERGKLAAKQAAAQAQRDHELSQARTHWWSR